MLFPASPLTPYVYGVRFLCRYLEAEVGLLGEVKIRRQNESTIFLDPTWRRKLQKRAEAERTKHADGRQTQGALTRAAEGGGDRAQDGAGGEQRARERGGECPDPRWR